MSESVGELQSLFTKRPAQAVTVTSKTKLLDALHKMRENGIHHLLVTNDNALVGIVSDRFIYERGMIDHCINLNPILVVQDVMQEHVPVIEEHTDLAEAMRLMRDIEVSALPVRRATGELSILTESDLLRVLAVSLDVEGPGDSIEQAGKVYLSNPLVQKVLELLNDVV